jgi:hypothetical protein
LEHTAVIPIVIVPASLTSLLTLYNVKEFLEDGLYVSHPHEPQTALKRRESTN